jgi:hypothetical protein
VGRLAYFDEEAQTYMVLTRDGTLVRVPLRDITSSLLRAAGWSFSGQTMRLRERLDIKPERLGELDPPRSPLPWTCDHS